MVKLARYEEDGWELLDAELIEKSHPSSFALPPLFERNSLRRGDFAKVIFKFHVEDESGASEERMWLKLLDKEKSGYLGVLDNAPTLISENDIIWRGSQVAFLPRHIVQILRA